jgi:hypothetical protein
MHDEGGNAARIGGIFGVLQATTSSRAQSVKGLYLSSLTLLPSYVDQHDFSDASPSHGDHLPVIAATVARLGHICHSCPALALINSLPKRRAGLSSQHFSLSGIMLKTLFWSWVMHPCGHPHKRRNRSIQVE